MGSAYNMYTKFLHTRSVPKLYYAGQGLPLDDRKQFLFVLAVWCSILHETPGLVASTCKQRENLARTFSDRNILNLFRYLVRHDLQEFFLQLDAYKALFQQWLVTDRCVKSLSNELGVDRHHPLWAMLGCLFTRSIPSAKALTHINTCVTFPKRASLDGDVERLEEEAYTRYLADEETLRELDENSNYEDDPLCQDLRRIVADLWNGFDEFEPTLKELHGTGATAETPKGASYEDKVNSVKLSSDLVSVLDAVGWRPNPYLYGGIGQLMPTVIQRWIDTFPNLLSKMGVRCLPEDSTPCEWDSVPKNAEKRRGVSIEGAARAFSQKCAAYPMRLFMAAKGDFHVDLFDQSKNQKLCLEGSVDGRFATGDLSSASDLNRASLVDFLFQDVPLVHFLLFATRSTTVSFRRVNDTYSDLQLRKFAPMGSATCFPALCTVLSAVITLAYERLGIHDDYRVYGDDIILRREAWPLVCEILTHLGFSVNTEKSFADGLYRESCGVEAYGGYDITPLKISQLFQFAAYHRGPKGRVEHLEALASLANRLWTFGYSETRASVCRLLRAVYPRVAFSHNAEHGILSPKAELNEHLETKCENGILYYRTYQPRNRQKNVPDELRYARWLEDADARSRYYTPTPQDCGAFHGGKTDTRLSLAWVPAWDLDYI
jgi:hypothetical protein